MTNSPAGRAFTALPSSEEMIQEFADELKRIKAKSGKSLRQMAKEVDYSFNALAKATSGERLPSVEVTRAFARACGADEQIVMQHRQAVARAISGDGRRPVRGRRDKELVYVTNKDPLEDRLRYIGELGHQDDSMRRFAVYLRTVCAQRRAGLTYAGLAEVAGVGPNDLVDWLNGDQLPDSPEIVRTVSAEVGVGVGSGNLLLQLYEDACRSKNQSTLELGFSAWSSALKQRGRDIGTNWLRVGLIALICLLLAAGFLVGRLL